jgi:prepilin-type N-terminal cleavage/methylation domain-containing protein/prepilin-type processing-associated H-X9-DG protein
MTIPLSTIKKGALDDWARRESLDGSGFTSGVKASKVAFTLIELLVVIAIIAILAAILLPVLSRAKAQGLKANCINNFKELQLCYRMYVDDNNDYLPENFLAGGVSNSWVVGNAQTDYNTFNIRHASIYSYNQNPKIYACPANTYPFVVTALNAYDDSGNVLKLKQPIPQTRTCSIEYSMGGNSVNSQYGPWTVTTSPGWNTYAKLSSVQTTRLSAKITFVDEASGGVDDGVFALWPMNSGINNWWNMPTSRHDRGGVFSFVDGHVEYHKWHGSAVPNNSMQLLGAGSNPVGPVYPSSPYWPADPVGTSDDLPWVQAGGPQYP